MDERPYYTRILLACWKCWMDSSARNDIALQRCGGCKRVVYCSNKCQQDDWEDHKPFCKAHVAVEKDPFNASVVMMVLQGGDSHHFPTTIERINYHAKAMSTSKALLMGTKIRPIEKYGEAEHNLIDYEPRCLECARTAQDIRIELGSGRSQNAQHPDRMIRPCDDCKYCFYCSDEHFEAARHLHSEIPYEDGHDDLSQCQMNKEIFFDSWLVSRIHEDGIDRDVQGLLAFMHKPGPIKGVWSSVEGMTWENEYLPASQELMEDNPISRAVFRRDTDFLTVSTTAVFALERFNAGDLAWTKKDVMTIHLIGAGVAELTRYPAFHDIFHRLPDLREIRVLLCGPQLHYLGEDILSRVDVGILGPCLCCASNQKKFTRTYSASTYHHYVQKQGEGYVKPDLVMAMNSGCGVGLETQTLAYQIADLMDECSISWRATEQLLVQKKIPTLFTANNADDALKDEQRLIAAGAKFVPGLERQRNPWGSLLTQPRPRMVRGFESYNRWIVGGFK